jgi:hypothetical protein
MPAHHHARRLLVATALLARATVTADAATTNSWIWAPRGHARTMFEAYRNPDFGLGGATHDSWLHQRVQAGFTASYTRRWDVAADLTWGDFTGKDTDPAPTDRDLPDLLQLYGGFRGAAWWARAGRQELVYGSGRLLAAREGANQRLAHDALRLALETAGGWRTDAFLASAVRVKPDAFDNASRPDRQLLWGAYATGPAPWNHTPAVAHGVDVYALGLRQEESLLAGPGATEHRYSLGTRWWGRPAAWDYNSEAILQIGRAGDRTILAGALSLGGGHTWSEWPARPNLGLRADLISGGTGSDRSHTFNPLFQANNYFNEGGYVSPANLWNLNPRLAFTPARGLTVEFGVSWLWRFAADDAVYGPPFRIVAPAAPETDPHLGAAFNTAAEWRPTHHVGLALGYTHHRAGPSLRAAGARAWITSKRSSAWASESGLPPAGPLARGGHSPSPAPWLTTMTQQRRRSSSRSRRFFRTCPANGSGWRRCCWCWAAWRSISANRPTAT